MRKSILPKGIPFQNITPAEALKRIEKSKYNKLHKPVKEFPIEEKRICANPKCKKVFYVTKKTKMQLYCHQDCRYNYVQLGKVYF